MMHRRKKQLLEHQHKLGKVSPGRFSPVPAALFMNGASQSKGSGGALLPNEAKSGMATAQQQFTVKCPRCSHRFRLLDSQAAADAETFPETTTAAPSASASMSPDPAGDFRLQPAKPTIAAQNQWDANTPGMQPYLNHTSSTSSSPACVSPLPPPPAADPPTSEVVRNYMITNISIEQLERVIMDKADRRIRKIAATSACSIDLRSEMPKGRFGVAKNFCVLRSRAMANLDSCRCMLVRQMGWNLAARLA